MRLPRAFMIAVVVVSCAAAQDSGEWKLRLVDGTGFGDPNNTGVTRMLAADGVLYLGTWNVQAGTKVYRSSDGERWECISDGGMNGNARSFATVGLVKYNGLLYVGTWNQFDGGSMFRANVDVTDPDAIEWETISVDGLGNKLNAGFTHMREFKGRLYAACFNFPEGSEVYRSESGDPGSWTMVIPKAWGSGVNTDATMMLEHDGYLYIGTESARDKQYLEGTQLWRTDGDLTPPYDQWQQVNLDGYSNGRNHNTCGLAAFRGKIYAATWNETQGFEVWRATPGDEVPFADWENVVKGGFGDAANEFACHMTVFDDTLFVGTIGQFETEPALFILPNAKLKSTQGGLLIKTTDGVNWEAVDAPGFCDSPTIGIQWLTPFKGKLYVACHGYGRPGRLWACERTP